MIYLEHGTVGGGFTEAANLKEKGGNKWLAKIYRYAIFVCECIVKFWCHVKREQAINVRMVWM